MIEKDSTNIRAHQGVAECFAVEGKLRNELDTWKIICQLHKLIRSKGDLTKTRSTVSLTEKIVDLVLPATSHSYVGDLLSLARKCYSLGEIDEAAEIYLDTLAGNNNQIIVFNQ